MLFKEQLVEKMEAGAIAQKIGELLIFLKIFFAILQIAFMRDNLCRHIF